MTDNTIPEDVNEDKFIIDFNELLVWAQSSGIYFNEEYLLWDTEFVDEEIELFPEGQFRFSTKELYQIFKFNK